jgi:glycosyltransferase involved in cell wall biosynthesis
MIVSVIVPVFNAAGSVARAIDSALAQTFTSEFEVIVINDGATDATAQILARYGNRIRVLKQNNRGPGAARNTGAANSDAEFLAFLDADDVWAPPMMESTVTALRHNPDAVLAYCNAVCVDSTGRIVAPTLVTPDRDHPPSMAELLTHWWPILPSAVTIRRCDFEQCGGFSEDLRAFLL